jgi:hypothetical protein
MWHAFLKCRTVQQHSHNTRPLLCALKHLALHIISSIPSTGVYYVVKMVIIGMIISSLNRRKKFPCTVLTNGR